MKIKILFTFALFITAGIVNAQYLMNAASNNTTVTTCSGTLADDGGAAGNYTASKVFVLTFTPGTAGTAVQLTFTQWSVAAGSSLEVFDGPTTASPSYGAFTNVLSPIGMQVMASISNPTGQITLRWTSGTTVSAGFDATINCHIPCQSSFSHIDSLICIPAMHNGYIDICAGQQITFAAHGEYPQNGTVYQQTDATSQFIWDFGDLTGDTGQVVTHTYTVATGYDFSVRIVDAQGCVSSNYATARVRISSDPIKEINPPPNFCSSNLVSFVTGTAAASTIVIDNVNGGASGELNVADTTFLPDGSGASYTSILTYSVFPAALTLTNINDLLGVCMNMEHSYLGDLDIKLTCPNGQNVQLKQYPGGAGCFLGEPIDDDASVAPCVGYDYCFSNSPSFGTMVAESTLHQYSYTDCEGNNYSNHNYLPAGAYTPFSPLNSLLGCPLNGNWTITVTDHLASDNGFIFSWGLSLNPALIPGGWTYVVPIDSVTWSGPFIQTTSDSTASIMPTTAGSFNYTATVWDHYGCAYDTSFVVQVVQTPLVDVGLDSSICFGSYIQLNAGNPGAFSYLWNTGATTQSIYADATKDYSVTVTNTDDGTTLCTSVDTMHLTVFPVPNVNFGPDVCSEVPLTLDANPGTGYIYTWSTGETTQTITAGTTGLYYVDVQSGVGSPCFDHDTIDIHVIPHPLFDLGPDTTICSQRSLTFNASQANESSEFTYLWFPNGTTTPGISFSPGTPGPHVITVVKTGCASEIDTVIVTGKLCDVTIPNVFTPNGDGKNDVFEIKGIENYPNTNLVIFNRWGKKVFEDSNYQNTWDGSNYSDGVYYYIVTFTDYLDSMHGTVTILK
jgi:gliding motility-associated-like protein